jgi:CheY-like chemotaxis protein
MAGYSRAMRGAKVLIVDDDLVIQRLLRLNFEIRGYKVSIAGDGLEALSKVRDERPDAVVLDIMMPKMDGIEVTRTLKADPTTESIPVVLLSAKIDEDDFEGNRSYGADAYMAKPFDPMDLLDRVRGLLPKQP